jgi:PilZ domain
MPDAAWSDRIKGNVCCANRQSCFAPFLPSPAQLLRRNYVEATRQDNRSMIRRRTQQLVYLELGKENGGVMLNLSEHGCGFQAITPVKCGETRFGFQINGGRRIAGDGEIVWADEAGVMGGLRFLNLPVEAHREIRTWLAETNAPLEHGFGPAADAPPEGGARRARAVAATEEFSAPAVSVRVAEEEPPAVAPAWANLRASSYAPIDDPRYGAPFQGGHAAFADPHRKSAAIWRGIAMMATLVALVGLVVIYQQDVGSSLIRLGEALTGKTKASVVAPDKQPSSAATPSAPDNSANPVANPPVPKTATPSPDDPVLPDEKDLATAGQSEAAAGIVPDAGNRSGGRPVSMLERPGVPAKAEPVWSAGDSVESLWGGVQSGSISAEVSLAERFAHGEGVNKNCDQAKVLMKAAADRGNREARLRLYQMETGGCR